MASLDTIFAREFKQTCQQRMAMTGAININDVPVPEETLVSIPKQFSKMGKVRIHGIRTQYYEGLNGTDGFLWLKPNLKRRQFDRFGNFKTENGKFLFTPVTLPQNCAAVISEVQVKVPLAFKDKEGFEFVDFIVVNKKRYFVYIIPKDYCYKLNELSLVLSTTRLRAFYSSIEVRTQSGHTLYVSVIPYNPNKAQVSNYRVISVGLRRDFSEEWTALYNYWVENNIVFPRELCELNDYTTGVSNVAFRELDASLIEYQKYDPEKPLSMAGNDSIGEDEFNNLGISDAT